MENNKKYTELLWNGKYPENWFKEFFELRKKATINIEKPNLAFQRVETINQPRVKDGIQSSLFPEKDWPKNYPKDWKNLLIWGDNKLVMSSLLKDFAGKINLIYIDPPFFTGANFSIKTKIGEEEVTKEAYRDTWGAGGMASYLKYMYERLILMRELLAENGSIYVHLDWHIGHYVKVMMDEIFGYENFRNELVWFYPDTPGRTEKYFNSKHDVILWYNKTSKYIFNADDVREEILPESKERYKTARVLGGRSYVGGKSADIGKVPEDVWRIPSVKGTTIEDIAFDTQKPEALLKRIILASSNPGDIVADFFCGSGTTLAVAEKLGRRWIGSDLSKFAIHTTRKRLMDIHNSKNLLADKNEIYGKPARPFEILNIANQENNPKDL